MFDSSPQLNERVKDANLELLRAQNAALLDQVQEMTALIRSFPSQITAARLDAKAGRETVYDYAKAARVCAIRV